MAANVERILARWNALKAARRNYETEWETLSEYCHLARQLTLTGGTPGSPLTGKVFDSLSFTAPQILAASLHANLTNPSTRWAKAAMRQEDLRSMDAVQDWSDDCSLRMDRARSASNFTSTAGEVYLELPVFGTGALLIEGKPPVRSVRWAKGKDGWVPTGFQVFAGFQYTAVPLGTYVIGEGRDGRVNTLIREVSKSVHAWAEEFGESRLPPSWASLLRDKPDEQKKLIHAVYPRTTDLWGQAATAMPFASVYFAEEGKRLVFESGYHTFPYAVPRWLKATGELYGRGQGHLALPDILILNERVEIRQWDWKMRLNPPLFQRPNAVRGDLNWTPGGRNYVDRPKEDIHIHYQPSSIAEALEQENRLEAKIRSTFFVDQILALPAPADDKIGGMSPYEVARRMEQVFRVLGPVYGNLEPEWLHAIVAREFDLMFRGGAFEPPPAAILMRPDADIDFVFDSPMSRAQRADDAAAVESAFATTGQLAQLLQDPAVWDNLDVDEGLRTIYEVRGVPAKVLKGADAVAETRAVRQEAMQQQQQQGDVLAASQVAKNLAPMVKAQQGGAGNAVQGQEG